MRSTFFYRKRFGYKQHNTNHRYNGNTRCNKKWQGNRSRAKQTANCRANHKPEANGTPQVPKPFTSFGRLCNIGYVSKQRALVSGGKAVNYSPEKKHPKCASHAK